MEIQPLISEKIRMQHETMMRLLDENNRCKIEMIEDIVRFRREVDELRSELKQREDELESLRQWKTICLELQPKMVDKNESEQVQLLKEELFKTQGELHQQSNKAESIASPEELDQAVTCSICMNERCSMAFQCGHLSCDECSDRLLQCHICRLDILQRTHIFF